MEEVSSGEEESPHEAATLFPRTFSTSALRIKGKFSFWERLHSSPTGGRFGGSYGIGPGLVSGYVTCVSAGKTKSFSWNTPCVSVTHVSNNTLLTLVPVILQSVSFRAGYIRVVFFPPLTPYQILCCPCYSAGAERSAITLIIL